MSEPVPPPLTVLCGPEPVVVQRAKQLADQIGANLQIGAADANLSTTPADLLVVAGNDPTHAGDDSFVRAAVLQRHDPREALVTRNGASLPEVARSKTATISVQSPTTRVQIVRRAPEVTVLPVDSAHSALTAVTNGEATALVAPIPWLRAHSSVAPGLVVRPLEHGEILHPIGSGIVSVMCRRDDARSRKAVAPVDDVAARQVLTAERELWFHITGDDPATGFTVAGHAETRLTATGEERLVLLGLLMTTQGAGPYRASHEVGSTDATVLGRAMAATLLAQYQAVAERSHAHSHDPTNAET
jgi:hydroxymethylbilane synthase